MRYERNMISQSLKFFCNAAARCCAVTETKRRAGQRSTSTVDVPDEQREGDLAAFEPSSEAVKCKAATDPEFVLGSVAPRIRLLLGTYRARRAAR
jgi:hypothetical protein